MRPNPLIPPDGLRPPVNSNVEAVGKPLQTKMQKRAMNLASQNRVDGAISSSGMVNVPPYLPSTARRGLFLQPR